MTRLSPDRRRPSRAAAAHAALLGALLLAGCAPALPRAEPAPAPPSGTGARTAAAHAAGAPLVVYVVRHAERIDASRDPSLSEAGRARATALAEALAHAGIGTVVTTQFVRTRETAAPIAGALGIEPVVVAAAGPADAHAADVARAVRAAPRDGAVLVVGHSNTVPAIVGALGGPRFDDLCDADYDNLFVLVLRDGAPVRLARARFGAADDESACRAMAPL
ncbi:MAG TPA: histidine phosphatase family protein [Gemmatimonadaceae bacterium]